MSSIGRHAVRTAALVACLAGADISHAACELHFAAPHLDLGTIVAGKGTRSETGEYRQVGAPRPAVLLITCDADRSALRLRVLNVETRQADLKLLRWDFAQPSGALRLRVVRALANEIPVELAVDGKAPVAAVDIDRNASVLSFDLAPVRSRARRFALEMQVTGFVADAFVPNGATTFSANPSIELLDP